METEPKEIKMKSIFVDGPITPEFIANSIAKHQTKKNIGAHDIFLGQVRNDLIEGKEVVAIDYSSYKEMAEQVAAEIREDVFCKYDLTCMHIYHSIGMIKAGEICLFLFVSSKQRKTAMDACQYLVEEIKTKLPVWGKEVFPDNSFEWKVNT